MEQNSNILIIKSGKKTKHFTPSEVAYIICDCSICDLYFVDGSKFICIKSLVYFEDVLPKDLFCRINHNIMINIRQVSAIISYGRRKHDVQMKSGAFLTVSYRKWMHLKAMLRGK